MARIDILDAAATSRLRPRQEGDCFHENEVVKSAVLEKISGIVKAAKAAVGKRHLIIHDGWGVSDETGRVARYTLPIEGDGKPAELSMLEGLIHDLRIVIFHANAAARLLRNKPLALVDAPPGLPDKTPR